MMNTILKKKAIQASATMLVFLLLVIVTIAIAAQGEGYIIAKEGGTVIIDNDTQLVIPKNALKEDTLITAKVVYNKNKVKFEFEPEGLVFKKGVYLQKSLDAMGDADGFTLYYAPDPNDLDNYTEEIEPDVSEDNVTWSLEHFSIYYHRRR